MNLPSEKEYQLLSMLTTTKVGGREIAKKYFDKFGQKISYGTLYTTLRRMKEYGWVGADDGLDPDGRVRYFWITPNGASCWEASRLKYQSLAKLKIQYA